MEEKYLPEEEHEDVRNLPFLTKNDLSNPVYSCYFGNKATFGSQERLKREKIIEQLFKEGKVIHSNCLTLVYLPIALNTHFPAQAMFSASKKKFKHAVDRNRAKRLMRESYRKQKIKLYEALAAQQQQMALCWVYKHKELLDYTQIYQEMEGVIERLLRVLQQK